MGPQFSSSVLPKKKKKISSIVRFGEHIFPWVPASGFSFIFQPPIGLLFSSNGAAFQNVGRPLVWPDYEPPLQAVIPNSHAREGCETRVKTGRVEIGFTVHGLKSDIYPTCLLNGSNTLHPPDVDQSDTNLDRSPPLLIHRKLPFNPFIHASLVLVSVHVQIYLADIFWN